MNLSIGITVGLYFCQMPILFVTLLMNGVMAEEIALPNMQRRQQVQNRIPGLLEYIDIDGTLCKINLPRIVEHKRYFNGQQKILFQQ